MQYSSQHVSYIYHSCMLLIICSIISVPGIMCVNISIPENVNESVNLVGACQYDLIARLCCYAWVVCLSDRLQMAAANPNGLENLTEQFVW